MSYYRIRFDSYEEFKRESTWGGDELGKEEIELLRQIDREEEFWRPRKRRRRRA